MAARMVEVVGATILTADITLRPYKPWESQIMKVYSGFQADFSSVHKEAVIPLISWKASSIWEKKKSNQTKQDHRISCF